MSDPLSSRLFSVLRPWLDAPAFRLALSGGLDSTVLLHLLAELRRTQALPALTAVHVHHGLQPGADAWAEHCRRLCERLSVPLEVARVRVAPGPSVEAQARAARYAALAKGMQPGEVLLTAQHRDDQAETVLFRLLRGAGVRGLAGMPAQRAFANGTLLRPLLGFTRAELETHARAQALEWVEDPSNADCALARNHLRRVVMPALQAHWPQASTNIARAARHLAEAGGLLDELARADLLAAQGEAPLPWLPVPSLALEPLRSLSPARQRNALRHWLAAFTRLPDSVHWAGWDSLRDAAPDASPRWKLFGAELQRSRDRIWLVADAWLETPLPVRWAVPSMALELPGNGRLEALPSFGDDGLEVRYRKGGERLHVPGRGRRDLKRLLNEQGWPPFLRSRVPLVYRGETLLAVANLAPAGADGPLLRWAPPAGHASLSW